MDAREGALSPQLSSPQLRALTRNSRSLPDNPVRKRTALLLLPARRPLFISTLRELPFGTVVALLPVVDIPRPENLRDKRRKQIIYGGVALLALLGVTL